MKRFFIEIPLVDCKSTENAEIQRLELVEDGYATSAVYVRTVEESTQKLIEAIEALDDMGDPDSLKVLSLIDRLLADDWTGCGVYEGLDELLKKAELASSVATEAVDGTTSLSINYGG